MQRATTPAVHELAAPYKTLVRTWLKETGEGAADPMAWAASEAPDLARVCRERSARYRADRGERALPAEEMVVGFAAHEVASDEALDPEDEAAKRLERWAEATLGSEGGWRGQILGTLAKRRTDGLLPATRASLIDRVERELTEDDDHEIYWRRRRAEDALVTDAPHLSPDELTRVLPRLESHVTRFVERLLAHPDTEIEHLRSVAREVGDYQARLALTRDGRVLKDRASREALAQSEGKEVWARLIEATEGEERSGLVARCLYRHPLVLLDFVAREVTPVDQLLTEKQLIWLLSHEDREVREKAILIAGRWPDPVGVRTEKRGQVR